MNYTSEIIIDLPLAEFISKFDSAENMKHWQRSLASIEHVSGIPGMIGSKMKLNYKVEKRNIEIIETITHRNLPYELHGFYSAKGIDNFQENYFEETPNGTSKWISKSEYLPLNLMMAAMLWLMPKTFKKQSKQYMMDFKNFAENGISVVHA
ncbi:MAG: SRPBCC family protein [Aquaticitalea sp.]